MAQKYWFKTHKEGIVWYPASWQGWVVVLVYLSGLTYYFIKVDSKSHSASDTMIGLFIPFFILSAFLIIITYLKAEPLGKKS